MNPVDVTALITGVRVVTVRKIENMQMVLVKTLMSKLSAVDFELFLYPFLFASVWAWAGC